MSSISTDRAGPQLGVRAEPGLQTARLLAAGVVAGPLFLAVAAVQGLVRDGFDITRHPISALSVGTPGWIQIADFIVAGILVIAAALGVRRVLGDQQRAVRWGTRLLLAHGLGLVAAGVFVTDAADGFPVGTPEGAPDTFSWHAILHGIATPVAFLAILGAAVVLARPLGERFGPRWRRGSRLVPAVVVALMVVPGLSGVSLRLALATAVVHGWLAVVARRAALEVRS